MSPLFRKEAMIYVVSEIWLSGQALSPHIWQPGGGEKRSSLSSASISAQHNGKFPKGM